ncbi:MAG: hypothetical protein KJ556_20085, partial [Gammaproteobacteria bacterium]|nr:hypothetical protein [Gammaproteobacteria bacterium]
HPDIFFLGEAPGEEEDNFGECFIGDAGQLLNRCFTSVGILRQEVGIWNIFQQRPPKNNVRYFFEDKFFRRATWEGQQHISRVKAFLERKRAEGNAPNLLVALGAAPMKVLTGAEGIEKNRGSILPCTLADGYKVYCTYHPSYVNRLLNERRENLQGENRKRQQNVMPHFLKDLERVKIQSEFPDIRIPERKFFTTLSFSECVGVLTKLNEDKEITHIAVDIETLRRKEGGSGPILWCIGFSPSPERAFVIPFIRSWRPAWSADEEAQLLILISRLFLNPEKKKIFQNGAYDLSILARYYGLRCPKESVEDTMLCYQAAHPTLGKSLQILCSLFTWEPYYKDEGKVHYGKRSSDEAEFRYNAKDCCVTREIWPHIERESREAGVWPYYRKTMDRQPSLFDLMIRGIAIDLETKANLSKEFTKKEEFAQSELAELTGMQYNMNAPKDMQKLLYGQLALPFQYNMKTGKVTTDKDALNKLKAKHPNVQELKHILEFKKFAKLRSTYADMTIDADGRVRTSYSPVSTFRLSSSESHFGAGGNLQNIPVRSEEGRMIRRLFIAEPGKVMVKADYSQIEARLCAYEASDLRQIKFFEQGWDIHWEQAKAYFGFDFDYEPSRVVETHVIDGRKTVVLVETMKFFRNAAKTIVHAGNYGMGPRMLQTILERNGIILSSGMCKELITLHLNVNPMILIRQRRVRDQINANRTIVSAYGRPRRFEGRLNDNLYQSAYAYSPQNTAG